MRKKNFIITGLACITVVGLLIIKNYSTDKSVSSYEPRVHQSHQSAQGNTEVLNMLRTGSPNGVVDPADRQAALQQVYAAASRAGALNLQWDLEGPINYGGRTRAILVDKDSSNVVWAGSVTGGLYHSTNHGDVWYPVLSFNQTAGVNQAISAMAQTGNGVIYVATGCTFESGGYGVEDSGSPGDGIWYSSDYGVSWTQMTGSGSWGDINEIAADPNDPEKLWIGSSATIGKIKTYTPAGGSVNITAATASSYIVDMQVANDNGKTIVIYGYITGSSVATYINRDANGSGTWDHISGTTAGQLPQSARKRVEYAISPDDANYIYAVAVQSSILKDVYMTQDMGLNWYKIAGVSTPTFMPFVSANGQGYYDCIITVQKGNKDRIILGGVDLYEWVRNPGAQPDNSTYSLSGQWGQISFWYGSETSPLYVHADNHEMVWGNDGVFYMGNDGGVFRSYDAAHTFTATNFGYSSTQPFNIAFSKEGWVMSGNQDNGTIFTDHTLTDSREAFKVRGGDGFACEISQINSDAWIASTYNGDIGRADAGTNPALWGSGNNWSDAIDFLGERITNSTGYPCGIPGQNLGSFYTCARLAEWPNDATGLDSIKVILDTVSYDGTTVSYNSQTFNKPLSYTEQVGDNFSLGDTVVLHDPIQSWFAFQAGSCGVYITRDAIRFSVTPLWLKATDLITDAKIMEFSPVNQNLYIGTWGGQLYRISGLDQLYSYAGQDSLWSWGDVENGTASKLTVTKIFAGSGSFPITGIALDKTDPEKLAFCRGGFSSGTHVYVTNSASSTITTSSFVAKNGDLGTNIPVYGIVFDQTNTNNIIIGTEYGIYSTNNGGTSWSMENTGMGIVPVFDLRIQFFDWADGANNGNAIYAGAHGKGIWSTKTIVSLNRPWEANNGVEFNTNLSVYPNPISDAGELNFELAEKSDVIIKFYDLNGSVVSKITRENVTSGEHQIHFNVGELAAGTYLIDLHAGTYHDVAKLVVK